MHLILNIGGKYLEITGPYSDAFVKDLWETVEGAGFDKLVLDFSGTQIISTMALGAHSPKAPGTKQRSPDYQRIGKGDPSSEYDPNDGHPGDRTFILMRSMCLQYWHRKPELSATKRPMREQERNGSIQRRRWRSVPPKSKGMRTCRRRVRQTPLRRNRRSGVFYIGRKCAISRTARGSFAWGACVDPPASKAARGEERVLCMQVFY